MISIIVFMCTIALGNEEGLDTGTMVMVAVVDAYLLYAIDKMFF